MRTLIFSDPHICKDNIEESKEVFDEIMSYKANAAVCLGDYYDRKMLSPDELIFGTSIMKQFTNKYRDVIMLEGNHDKDTVKYLQSLGITVVENIVIDNDYYGHFFVENSAKSFNSDVRSLSEFENYRYVFLGHQHSFQNLGKNRFHPGSVIWVDFGEVNDVSKSILMLEDGNLEVIELKTPIPMTDVIKIEDLEKIPPKTKVRYLIKNFNQLKSEANKLEKYKGKFYQFKVKLDFDKELQEVEISPKKNISEIVQDWLNTIKDKEVKKELELSFKGEKNDNH